jgi:hypothetical protein
VSLVLLVQAVRAAVVDTLHHIKQAAQHHHLDKVMQVVMVMPLTLILQAVEVVQVQQALMVQAVLVVMVEMELHRQSLVHP